ncbi:acyltransferase [Actinoallomurus sp. NBC_01490]|uniref:acyltransferase family protein n=1 Tax=Actinoallomurus sp. NBC_01490 TaxID=2903557 RepID=UPI002E32F454|nr:acyltransferase [Actinoallomurus sp. NBC_01490]
MPPGPGRIRRPRRPAGDGSGVPRPRRPATGWSARIEAATPAGRDRTVDAARAVAMAGVVLGHWLVSALVSDPYRPAALRGASPLAYTPGLSPLTWPLQTLGLFFFAGGFAAARGLPAAGGLRRLGMRVARLTRPVAVLLAVWLPALPLLSAAGGTRQAVWSLVSHPLWFLLVYLMLTAAAPLLRAAVLRWGAWAALPPAGIVALADGFHPPYRLGLVTVPVAWAAPYVLGIALAEGRLRRRAGAVLVPLGVAGGAVLLLWAGYPASAVGVPGAGRSNLDPPSLFTLALAAAQIGVFLLVRPWLARLLRRPARWAPVAVLNLGAMTVYCWHQTALLLVTFAALPFGRPPGLLDAPAGDWPLHRLAWLPAFALVLAGLCAVFHRAGHPRSRPARPGTATRGVMGRSRPGRCADRRVRRGPSR